MKEREGNFMKRIFDRIMLLFMCALTVICFTCCGKRQAKNMSNENVENNNYVAKAIQKEVCNKEEKLPYTYKLDNQEYEFKYDMSYYTPCNNEMIDQYSYVLDEGIIKE